MFTSDDPYISMNLDVSTCHITENDAALLDSSKVVVVHKYEEGYFVFVPEDPNDFYDFIGLHCIINRTVTDIESEEQIFTDAGFSKDFVNLMKLARQHGCKYLQLDRDGREYGDLPKYSW